MSDQAGGWREANRARWDELTEVHLAPGGYDVAGLRAGTSRLDHLAESELGPVAGLRILHLQCHFGSDTLTLARQGAEVVGLDFSPAAIEAARALTNELGLAGRARFVQADLYDAPNAIEEPASFDRVFVTWGAINWLPDIAGWARIVAHFLRPGGTLYLADQHPTAFCFDDRAVGPDGMPGLVVPYFTQGPIAFDDAHDYINQQAVLSHTREHVFPHPLGAIVTALIAAGLRLDWLHEHDWITWRMFRALVPDARGGWRWPDNPWLPLAFSLAAHKVRA